MNNDLQAQIDTLTKRLDALNSYSTIPLSINNSWKAKGFIKTDFFVAGYGSIAFNGLYRLTIPGATRKSIVLTSSEVVGFMEQAYDSTTYGDATSQYDITNPAGDTFRYTYDGTGTDPNINATTLPIGSQVTIFGDFSSDNEGTFITTGGGANFFEISNPTPGIVESNVDGFVVGGPLTDQYGIVVEGSSGTEFPFVVFLFTSLFEDSRI